MAARLAFRGFRRRALLAALGVAGWLRAGAAAAPGPWIHSTVAVPEPMCQLQAGGPSGLLGTGASGRLWALSLTGQAPRRLADELDAATPVATGHGRIAARTASGGLWVWADGSATRLPSAALAAHAGLLILPSAVVGVVGVMAAASKDATSSSHHVARFEQDNAGAWRESARSRDSVLPDARPLQVDLDGHAGSGRVGHTDGHIVVLAGPDARRYGHAVLGDGIEATRMLWLERHSLEVMRALTLPEPHVFEDIAPRPVLLPDTPSRYGMLTIRSGPDGGQLALVTADLAAPQALHLAALGDTVGGFHRWLAPSTDGRTMVAVHTPHIGGVLHVYQAASQRLTRRRLLDDVSTHRIGSRELDLSVWWRGLLVLPSQDGRRLRVLDTTANWTELNAVSLPGHLSMVTALPGTSGLATLLDDGSVAIVRPAAGASRAQVARKECVQALGRNGEHD